MELGFVETKQYISVMSVRAANLCPALEHASVCGKQTPSTSFLFFRTNLLFFCLFVCLFVGGIKPENPYFASRHGLEVNPLGVYPPGPRSSSCGPTKGTPPPRTNQRAN